MKKSHTMIVASVDTDVTTVFQNVSADKNFDIIIEQRKLQVIWDTLDKDVLCLVIDMENFADEEFALINIIKRVRPRLPIIAILADDTSAYDRHLAETGIFYRTTKPLSVQEVEQVVDAIEKIVLRESDLLSASL